MKILSRLKNNPDILCACKRTSTETPVQNGLALTPAKVKEYTDKGIAVSVQNMDGYYDSPESGFELDAMYTRGSDRNMLWEKSQLARQRIFDRKDKLTLDKRIKKSENG